MQRKTRIAALAIAAALLAAPLAAQAQVVVGVRIGPPAPRYEPVPAPRAGFFWAPGHWAWTGGHYVWGPGRWIAERPGYRWAPGVWEHRPDGWAYTEGHWVR